MNKVLGSHTSAEKTGVGYPEGVDELILPIVHLLNVHGFKTFESCQGGEGHCCADGFIKFKGDEMDLIRAYEICELNGVSPLTGNRVYRKAPIYEMGCTGPEIGETWDKPFNELIFLPVTLNALDAARKDYLKAEAEKI